MIAAMDKGEIDAIAYDRPILKRLINSDTISNYSYLKLNLIPSFIQWE